jgi:hypothetical protein
MMKEKTSCRVRLTVLTTHQRQGDGGAVPIKFDQTPNEEKELTMKTNINTGSAAYLRQQKAYESRPPDEIIYEFRELLCEAYHGPKPQDHSVPFVFDLSKRPTADNIGWATQIQSRWVRKPRKKR